MFALVTNLYALRSNPLGFGNVLLKNITTLVMNAIKHFHYYWFTIKTACIKPRQLKPRMDQNRANLNRPEK